MGLNLIRWWVMRGVGGAGRVLEVGCGTGLNLPYYSLDRLQGVVAVDAVPEMLQEARRKHTNKKVDRHLNHDLSTSLCIVLFVVVCNVWPL